MHACVRINHFHLHVHSICAHTYMYMYPPSPPKPPPRPLAMSRFHATLYTCPENAQECQQLVLQVVARIEELEGVLQNSRAVKKVELLRIAESLEVWNRKVGVASECGGGTRRWVGHQKVKLDKQISFYPFTPSHTHTHTHTHNPSR